MNSENENNSEAILNRYIWGNTNPGDDTLIADLGKKEENIKKNHEAIVSLKNVFGNIPPWELAVMADELEPETPAKVATPAETSPKVVSLPVKKKSWQVYSVAAALTLSLFSAGFIYLSNQANKRDVMLTMGIGKCTSQSGPLTKDERLTSNQVTSGSASVCDLRFLGNVKVAVRLKPDSVLDFKQSPSGLSLFVKKGGLLLNLSKVSAGQHLKVLSAGHDVRILGTRLSLNRNPDESLKLRLFEGLAEVRSANAHHLNNLHNPAIQKFLPALRSKYPVLFAEQRQSLKPGEFLDLQEDQAEQVKLKALYQNLDGILAKALSEKDPALAFQQNSPLWKSLDASLQNVDPEIQTLLEKRKINIQTGTIDAGGLWRLERQFQGLTPEPIPDDGNKKESRKIKRESILNSVQQADAEPPHLSKITLKNGKTYIGQVKGAGDTFRLETRSGDFIIAKRELGTVDPLE